MKKAIFYLLTLIGVLWIQVALNYLAGLTGFSANIVLIVVIYFGLSRGPMVGQMLGFTLGLFMDASSLGLMGLQALLFACTGYLAGMLRRQLDENKVWTQTIFTLGISILYILLYFTLDRMFSTAPHPWSWSMVAQPVLNAIVAPVFFWMMARWSQVWDLSVEQD